MGAERKVMSGEEPTVLNSNPIPEDITIWRGELVRRALRALVIFGAIAAAAGTLLAISNHNYWIIPFYGAAYAGLILITYLPRIPYSLQAWVLAGLIYGVGVLDIVESGRGGDGRVFLLAFPLMVVLLFGSREGIIALVIDVLTQAFFGWAYTSGLMVIPIERQTNYANPVSWLSNTVVLVMLGALLVTAQSYLMPRLAEALANSRKLVRELSTAQAELKSQSIELKSAHQALAERAKALETTTELARKAALEMDQGELLQNVVTLVSERFGFYHAGIFLLDPRGEWAVLQAASSQGGRRMLARGHRLRVGQEGMVGFVASQGQPRIALNVGADAVFFDNPDLPDTHSEMTLPLRVRDEIIGALDVQSTQPNAFGEEDITMLQAIADQVAMVISNVRLFQQTQESLETERRVYGELSNKAWNELIRSRSGLGYQFKENRVSQIKAASETSLEARDGKAALALPVQIRGHDLGTLKATKPAGEEWSAEEINLVKSLVDQLGVALESARLFQETQRRAERERLASEITAKIRATNDPQVIVQTAIQELRQALIATRAQISIQSNPDFRQS